MALGRCVMQHPSATIEGSLVKRTDGGLDAFFPARPLPRRLAGPGPLLPNDQQTVGPSPVDVDSPSGHF